MVLLTLSLREDPVASPLNDGLEDTGVTLLGTLHAWVGKCGAREGGRVWL